MNISRVMTAMLLTPTPWGWGIPCLYTGKPGRGKTTIAHAVARSLQAPTVLIAMGEVGEAYLGAVPAVANGRISYPCPAWVDDVANGGIVIVDELRTAPQATRPQTLGLVLARRVGGHQLSRDVSIIALSNNAEDCPDGSPLDPAMSNRFVHIPFEAPSPKAWLDAVEAQVCNGTSVYAPEGGETLNDARARVAAAWDIHAAVSVGALRAVIKAQPKIRYMAPKEGQGDGPWASERSWTLAALVAASCSLHGLSNTDRATLIEGCVGPEPAGHYLTMLDRPNELPDVAALLAGTATWAPDAARPDITMQVVQNIAEEATSANGDQAYRLLIACHPYAPDAVALAAQNLFATRGITPNAPDTRGAVLSMMKGLK